MKVKLSVKTVSHKILLIIIAIAFSAGCIHLKGKNHNRIIASQETIRQIEPIKLEEAKEEDVITLDTKVPELAEIRLSLEECKALAIENNLGLKVQLINPVMAAEMVTQEKARFDVSVLGDSTYIENNTPVATILEIAGNKYDTFNTNYGFNIPLRTGGNITLGMTDVRTKTDSRFSINNPSYTSNLSATINHPLLRNAGEKAGTYRIRFYEYERQITDAQTKAAVITLIADVEKAYWQLHADRKMLDVYKQQYELSKDLFEQTQRLVEIGITPEIELYRTRSGVQESLDTIITAENNVRNSERAFKLMLNKPDLGVETKTVLIPTSEPDPVRYEIDREQMIVNAIENRMDILELEIRLAQDASEIENMRNRALPKLDLNYTYKLNGLGKGRNDSYGVLFDNNFKGHTVRLDFSVPLGNRAAESALRNAIYNQKKRKIGIDTKKDQIKNDVLYQIDWLETCWQHIIANKQKTVYRDQEYKAEKRSYELGMSTSRDVLLAQSSLANAQSSEINALARYQKALVDLAKATGTMLGKAKVHWEPLVPED